MLQIAAIPEDILEPKSWDLNFMYTVEPVFIEMVQLQKWRKFLTYEDAIYPNLVREVFVSFRSTT